MSTYEDALAVETVTEIRDGALADLATLGSSLLGVPVESADRGLIEIFARAQASQQTLRSYIAYAASKAKLMTLSDIETRDAWLDVMATGWFGLERLTASKASHRFRLVASAGAGPYTIAPQSLTAQTDDGTQFKNTGRLTSALTSDPATIILAAAGTRDDLEWEAVLPGIEGNITVDSALELVTTLAGVAITNPQIGSTGSSLLVSGADEETSESLSLRCDARWNRTAVAQLPGALVEWIFESFEVDLISCSITKWRIDDANPNGAGSTDVYISPGTAAELARVDAYLQARRGLGSGELRTLAASTLAVAIAATIYELGNSATNESDCQTVVDTLEALLPIGGTLYGDDITKALRSISDIYHVTHDLEGITTVAGISQVMVLTLTVTVG